MKDIQQISKEIEGDFSKYHEDEAQLLHAIAQRVDELLRSEPGLLFSYLYRLDVLEHKVRAVIADDQVDQVQALAELIYERQKLRLYTKKTIKQAPIQGWEW